MLDHPSGAGSEGDFRVNFDPRVRLEFHGSKISSDGGLLLFRELDETLGLHDLAGRSLRDTRTGKTGSITLWACCASPPSGDWRDTLMSTMRIGFPVIR